MPDLYQRRWMDNLLDEVFVPGGLPAIMLIGARGTGKTTTALRHSASAIRLDRVGEAQAFSLDADAILDAKAKPVLVDEWQEVPAAVSAIKRAVDSGLGGGSILVTGSVRARRTGQSWPGTGRIVPLRMFGLTEAEIAGRTKEPSFIDEVFSPELEQLPVPQTSIVDNAARIARGSFPEVLNLGERERSLWYLGYADQLVHRDIEQLSEIRQTGRLMTLLEAVASVSASTTAISTLANVTGISTSTTASYLDLLEDLGLVIRLPAWHNNLLKRLSKSPKIHMTDTGLATQLLGLEANELIANGPALGHLLETFVVMQLMPLLQVSRSRIQAFHLRDQNGRREIDIILQKAGGKIVAIEVKAAANVTVSDARNISWLRNEIGPKFHRGIVLYSGQQQFQMDKGIWAMPIQTLWS